MTFHSLRPQSRQHAATVSQWQAQGPTLWPLLKPLWDLLLPRAVVPASKANGPDPGLAPLGGSSAAMKACRTATSPRDRETGRGGRKAQVNTACSGHGSRGAATQELAGGDRTAPGREGVNPARSDNVPDTGGKAGVRREPAPPAVQQADGETLPGVSSEVGLRALRGAEIQTHRWAAQVPGQGGWRTWCLNPQGEEEGQRGEKPVAALMLLSTVGCRLCSPLMRGSVCHCSLNPGLLCVPLGCSLSRPPRKRWLPGAPSQSLSPESPRLHTVQTGPGPLPRCLQNRTPGPAGAAPSARSSRWAQTLLTAQSALWGLLAARSDRNCRIQPPRTTGAQPGLHPP